YNSTIGSTPPASVTASYGSQGALTHLIHVDGSTITDWMATNGTATFTKGTTGPECSLPKVTGVTCLESTLQAAFNVISASPANQPGNTRTASLATIAVSGVMLQFAP